MNWPRKPEQPAIKHWPSDSPTAFGQVKPACNANWGFYARPVFTKRVSEITCEKCRARAGGETNG